MTMPTTRVEFKVDYSGSSTHDGLPEHNFSIVVPDSTELSTCSWFKLFEQFLAALGYNESSIMSAACGLAFNDLRDHKEMKKIAHEHDLRLVEDPEPDLDLAENTVLSPKTNKSKKPLFEVVRNNSDLYGSLWPQKLAKIFRDIADEIETSGEDEFGVYQTTGEDVREWLYKEAQKAELFLEPKHEPEREP